MSLLHVICWTFRVRTVNQKVHTHNHRWTHVFKVYAPCVNCFVLNWPSSQSTNAQSLMYSTIFILSCTFLRSHLLHTHSPASVTCRLTNPQIHVIHSHSVTHTRFHEFTDTLKYRHTNIHLLTYFHPLLHIDIHTHSFIHTLTFAPADTHSNTCIQIYSSTHFHPRTSYAHSETRAHAFIHHTRSHTINTSKYIHTHLFTHTHVHLLTHIFKYVHTYRCPCSWVPSLPQRISERLPCASFWSTPTRNSRRNWPQCLCVVLSLHIH